jgi:oxidase EvaA
MAIYFLMQAKMEPGNIDTVQLAPTLQATRSNFTRVHGGRTPPYLDFFTKRNGVRTLVDVLQSEQGARFLHKRNRNIIIEVDGDVPVFEDYCWLTLGQIQKMIGSDNLVNMDARTVLSCIGLNGSGIADHDAAPTDLLRGIVGGADTRLTDLLSELLASIVYEQPSLHPIRSILSWFTELKFRYELLVERIPLKYVQNWLRTEEAISHEDGKYFSVIAVRVQAENREVTNWAQPLVKPGGEGVVAFVLRRINGVLHLLVQAKVEPGNFDVLEMAPTVQCLTGSYRDALPTGRPPFLDYVLQAPPDHIVMSTLQSEEGGRFFQEANRNLLVMADECFPLEVPKEYIWMTPRQLSIFIQFNNFVNVQARCLLAAFGSH